MPLSGTVEEVLQRHGYSTLPASLEGTRLAVLYHGANGMACADVLVYREVNGSGETLKNEAALLVDALPRISQQLCRQPSLLSLDLQTHAIAFLGKKVHVLVGGDGRLLRCGLFPLLILHSTTTSQGAANPGTPSLPIVSAGQLDQYMARQHHATSSESPAIDAWLLHFRRSFQLLSAALLVLPSLLGLSLLLASLGWLTAAVLSFIVAALGPPTLLLAALRHFRRFGQQNPTSIHIAPKPPALVPTDFAVNSAAHPDSSLGCGPIADEAEGAPWTQTNTAAFLSDSMQSSITACLSAYKAANWRAYAGHLNSLLINGVRLATLKRTGRIPTLRLDEMLDQLPASNARDELDAWLRRLATARQTQPRSIGEMQQAAHFGIQLLRELHVMPSTWEAQMLRTIMRPSHNALNAGSQAHLAPTDGVVLPANPPSQNNPLLESANTTALPVVSTYERVTTTLVPPGETTNCQVSSVLTTTSPLGSSDRQGAPLNISSERDLDLLIDMLRAGASPYLLVFGNRYLAHWKTLREMVDQAAQRLPLEVNVIVLPGLGDQKVDSKVEVFYHCFHVEGESVPLPLPLICVLSRTVLLHVLEDNLPVPSELVVDPRPEGFLDRVRTVIPTAQAYQVNLKALGRHDETVVEMPPQEEDHLTEGLTSQFALSPAGIDTPRDVPRPVSPDRTDHSLVADVDDVVEEVESAPLSRPSPRVTEVNVAAALHRRELATLLPVALAVVHLPEQQHVLDALEAAAQEEENLVAEYVNSARYPNAVEALRTEAGIVRLRYNGSERLLEVPDAPHLVESIRQLRTANDIAPATGVVQASAVPPRKRRSKAGQRCSASEASAAGFGG